MSTDDDTPLPVLKTCTTCGVTKPTPEFSRQKLGRDGLRAMCRVCNRAASLAWRAANHERNLANMALWRAANRDVARAASATWRAANQERVRSVEAQWRAEHPDVVRDKASIRRALKRNAPVVERIRRAVVWERDGGLCHICGKKADPNYWHLEHLVPLSRGGEHSYRNVAVSHPTCNMRKGVAGPAQLRLLPESAPGA